MPTGRVLGVDACKAGWVGVALSGAGTQAYVATDITTLVSLAAADDGDLMAVAIDIPIGRALRGIETHRDPAWSSWAAPPVVRPTR